MSVEDNAETWHRDTNVLGRPRASGPPGPMVSFAFTCQRQHHAWLVIPLVGTCSPLRQWPLVIAPSDVGSGWTNAIQDVPRSRGRGSGSGVSRTRLRYGSGIQMARFLLRLQSGGRFLPGPSQGLRSCDVYWTESVDLRPSGAFAQIIGCESP